MRAVTFIIFDGPQSHGSSEAFRDLIRDRLVKKAVEDLNARVVGTVTLIYDHHARLLPEKLADLQHRHHELIISTTHVHLDHDTCLEVIVVRGASGKVQKLADLLIGTKGVQHGRLVMSLPTIGDRDGRMSNTKVRNV